MADGADHGVVPQRQALGGMSHQNSGHIGMDERRTASGEPGQARTSEPVWHVLYRFLWPFQYFRDVTKGDRRQQELSYRHNRAMRFCLPGFMLKWSALSAHWFAWGSFLDSSLSLTLLMAGCFVAGSLALIVVLLLGIDWLWLERFSDRF